MCAFLIMTTSQKGFKMAYKDAYTPARWHHSYRIVDSWSKPWLFNFIVLELVHSNTAKPCQRGVFLLCHDCARLISASLVLDTPFLE